MKSEKELEKKLRLFKNTFEKKIARNENIIKKAKQDYLKEIIGYYDYACIGCNDISVFEEWLMEEKKKHGVE